MNMTLREALQAFFNQKLYKDFTYILIALSSLYGAIYTICGILYP